MPFDQIKEKTSMEAEPKEPGEHESCCAKKSKRGKEKEEINSPKVILQMDNSNDYL